jgi:hypothetical protein
MSPSFLLLLQWKTNIIAIVFIFWDKGLSNTNERLSDGGRMLLDIIRYWGYGI